MFPYSFRCDLRKSVVKIEFGPVGNPIWRQVWRKVPKNREFFFFELKEDWDLILTMINGDRNSWTARKNLPHRSQIAIPFAKWRICNIIMKNEIPDFLVLLSTFGTILDFLLDQTQFWPRILEEHTQNYKETWVSFKYFSFSVMRMRLEQKSKNCSSWSLMG